MNLYMALFIALFLVACDDNVAPNKETELAAQPSIVNTSNAKPEIDSQAQTETWINQFCTTHAKHGEEQSCRDQEHLASDALGKFGKIPKPVFDKCTAGDVVNLGFSGALKCLQDSMAPSNNDAAKFLSDYAGAAQAQFLAMSAMNNIYVSKIQQDIQFGSLDNFRRDAEAMTDMAREGQRKLSELSYPETLSETQSAQFEEVLNAINDFSAAFLSMNADVAVNAHTGINVDDELEKDIGQVAKAGRKFKSKVLAAYKSFGYSANKIDSNSLMIKDSNAN